jgi:hypothetical protein
MKYNKINIYNRHFSRNKTNPLRPRWFDYEKTFVNLLNTTNFDICNLTVIFEKEEDYNSYFIKKYEGQRPFKVKFINTERDRWLNKTSEDIAWSRSIAAAAEVIHNDNLPSNELVYISDDDFLHVPYWSEVMKDYIENFIPDENFWVCPCDYGDKYYFVDEKQTIDQYGTNLGMYANLTSKIRISNYCHWRSVPNCLTSSMMPVNTFNRDFDPYWKTGYSDGSLCHALKEKYGTQFWSPIKSLSCHVVHPFIPPFVDWEKINNL